MLEGEPIKRVVGFGVNCFGDGGNTRCSILCHGIWLDGLALRCTPRPPHSLPPTQDEQWEGAHPTVRYLT